MTQSWSGSTSKKNAIAVLTNQTNLRLEQESVAFVNAGIESAVAISSSFVPFPELVEADRRWLKVQSNGVTHDYTEQRAAVAGKSHVLLAPTTKAVEALKREIPEGRYKQSKRFCSLHKKARSFKRPSLPLTNGDCCPTDPVTNC